MGNRLWLGSVLLLALCTAQVSAFGQNTREQIQRSKSATAFLDLREGQASATATCIHASGIFVTNRHCVKDVPKDAKVKLVVNPGQEGRREFQAKVLRIDNDEDLALLQVEAKAGDEFAFLTLGSDQKLFETMQITTFGYPFGKRLAAKDEPYPELSVNVGRITSFRNKKGVLHRIQVDAVLNPGNSGGPMIDESGAVIGLVDSGVALTGVNFAIPVRAIRQLLSRPEVIFQPPVVTTANKHEPAEFRIKVLQIYGQSKDLNVEVQLASEGRPLRTYPATLMGEHDYVVKAPPLPAPANAREPATLQSSITFKAGLLKGTIKDQPVDVGGKPSSLAELRTIQWEEPAKTVRHDGSELPGNLKGLDKVKVDVGSYQLEVDLTQARRMDLQAPSRQDPTILYTLLVRDGKEELARLEGPLAIQGSEPAAGVATSFVPYQGAKVSLEVPDAIGDVERAGGGRYLLIHLPKSRKIAVYDVNQTKITRYISSSASEIFVAGGLEKFVVVSPSDGVIERWSLETFQKETSQAIPVEGVVKTIAMGYASNGPLLILSARSTDALGQCKYELFNLDFKKYTDNPIAGRNTSYRDAVHIRASGTGDLFGLWATSHSPQGMETFSLQGNTVKPAFQHESAGHIVPNFDGSAVLTGFAGLCTPGLDRKSPAGQARNQRLPLVPSTHPRFYVSVPAEPGAQINLGFKPFEGIQPSVFVIGSDTKLVDLPSLELGTSNENASWGRGDFTLDKRVCFVPQANQLITFPYSNDRLIVLPVNLRAMLDKAEIDYFYITSVPTRTFVKGQTWRYSMEVASRREGVEYEISSGPEGMKMDRNGNVQWAVPGDFNEKLVTVILTAKNSQGQSQYDTFKLAPR